MFIDDYNADLIDIMADEAEALEEALAEADFWAMVDEAEAVSALAAQLAQCETVADLVAALEA